MYALGTVVDRGVTEARNWDFFRKHRLPSKPLLVRPITTSSLTRYSKVARYRPLFQNAADALEDPTHNMCYLFGRGTKAVSICPAAYYADLVRERARCYLSRLFDTTPGATPRGSVVEEGGPGTGLALDLDDVRIHKNVRDTMFYD